VNDSKDTTITAQSRAPLLEIDGLRIEFDTPSGVLHAVNGVSIRVDRGEVVGLVGESGCGKSVTARSILGLLGSNSRIVEGRILFEGIDLLELERRDLRRIRGKEIGFVSQDPMISLNPMMKVGKQVTEGLRTHLHMSKAEAKATSLELLDVTGIRDPSKVFEAYPGEMSGGMLQRVAIAIAVSCKPKLLIADEPTTALDTTIQARVLAMMSRLCTEMQMAMILITHDLGVVASMVDRANVMYAGRVLERAGVDDLFYASRHPYALGLLELSPRADVDQKQLVPIPGVPPDMRSEPPGCRFEPRCSYRIDRCADEEPGLDPVGGSSEHSSRCWVLNPPVVTVGGRVG
jgi:oligopeptide/dipeptide ABC transporter ATP-binding protein